MLESSDIESSQRLGNKARCVLCWLANKKDNVNEPMTPEMKARLIAIAKNKKNVPDTTPEEWEAVCKKYGTVELPPAPPSMTPEEIADLMKRYPG
jgi:hypothetical protein